MRSLSLLAVISFRRSRLKLNGRYTHIYPSVFKDQTPLRVYVFKIIFSDRLSHAVFCRSNSSETHRRFQLKISHLATREISREVRIMQHLSNVVFVR